MEEMKERKKRRKEGKDKGRKRGRKDMALLYITMLAIFRM